MDACKKRKISARRSPCGNIFEARPVMSDILVKKTIENDTAVLKASDFLGDDEPLLSFMIGNIRNEMTNQCARELNEYGLTLRNVLVMAYLEKHEGELVTQKTLEDHMHLSNPTVTVLIQNMEKKGLVTRRRVPEDGRKYRLALTDRALEIGIACREKFLARERQFYDGITEEEKKQLFRIFQKIEKNLGFSSVS